MTDKEILLIAFHTQAGSISWKKDVRAPTAQNAVSVSVQHRSTIWSVPAKRTPQGGLARTMVLCIMPRTDIGNRGRA